MTEITVLSKSRVPMGPFTREQIDGKLRAGEIALEDLAFMPGLSQWTPLRDVLARADGALLPTIPAPVASPAYSYAVTMQPPSHLVYGGFWLRFVAHFLDALIVSIPMAFVGGATMMIIFGFVGMTAITNSSETHSPDNPANLVFPLGIILVELIFIALIAIAGWLYYALLESGPLQATYGKRVMGLRVIDMRGIRITFAHASGRYFSKIITGLVPFGIGYMMAGFTERKQALHDFIAGTLVVRN